MDLDPKKCQYIKKEKQCGARPMKGTDYCYAHTKHKQDYIVRYAKDDKGVCGVVTVGGNYVALECYNPGEFFSVPNRIFHPDVAELVGMDGIAVFCCLCNHVKRFNEHNRQRMPAKAFPEIQTIANKCGCDPRRVRRAIKKLVDCNILYVEHRWKNKKTGKRTANPDDLENGKWESTSNMYYIIDQWEWYQ